uniref:oxysterol-binding protein 1-like isoform X1 n=1 Tax=Styela clava TaxID=7725 RepID=UPI00193A279A|nr:oxysterol-binding protein 1-like isoform X1 [Styela clava]
MSDKAVVPGNYKGWLWKWTNYVKGYQKRWFVLSNGLLSYYKSQAEVSVACRGTVILAGASIVTEDSCHFTISNGSAHRYHLKAGSEIERQRWITALELAKTLSTQMLDSVVPLSSEESSDGESTSPTFRKGSVDVSHSDSKKREFAYISRHDQLSESEKHEIRATLTPLEVKLADLETCNNLIGKHGTTLLSALADLEIVEKQLSNNPKSSSGGQNVGIAKLKVVNERAMLFRITSSAMISACTEFLQVAKTQSKKWQKMLTHEKEQRLRLEETVETLAKQHNSLERALNAATGPPRSSQQTIKQNNDGDVTLQSSAERQVEPQIIRPLNTLNDELSDEDDEFMDAYEDAYPEESSREERTAEENQDKGSISTSSSHESTESVESGSETKARKLLLKAGHGASYGGVIHRTRIPFKPSNKLNLWSFMKNCIGRDLSKIPMPVNFNEPLSFLQRLSEDLEYSELLDRAARCTDSCEQLAYVAAFSVSSYSTTLFRIGKPFNPLLGETYEFDSLDEHGYRLLAEQVSHHPPSAACYAETTKSVDHGGWSFWEQITLVSKFRGKYISFTPIGTCHVKFHKTGHHYTWNKATITIHNIIVGKLWVDQSGESNIVNHVTDDKCKITFFPYSYFSRDTPRKISGFVIDKDGNERFQVFGTWDASVKCKKVDKATPKSQQNVTLLWQKYPLPLLAEKMYYFTKLALILNEWVDGTAPTDSRRRPDQRKMEEAAWDESNKIKLELEEKQRCRRKLREMDEAKKKEEGVPVVPYRPRWFKKTQCPLMDEDAFVFTHEYWEAKKRQDWGQTVNIFDLDSEKPETQSTSTADTSTVLGDLPKSASEGQLTPYFVKQPVDPPQSSVVS